MRLFIALVCCRVNVCRSSSIDNGNIPLYIPKVEYQEKDLRPHTHTKVFQIKLDSFVVEYYSEIVLIYI